MQRENWTSPATPFEAKYNLSLSLYKNKHKRESERKLVHNETQIKRKAESEVKTEYKWEQ